MFNDLVWKRSEELTLNQIFERLCQKAEVDGIIIMGSRSRDAMTISSDNDVCIVLNNPPVPIWLALTEVEGRVSEFYFISSKFVNDHIEREKLEIKANTIENTYLSWIATGKIIFDRTGKIAELRQKILTTYKVKWENQAGLYSKWFEINYNLRETSRLLKSDDAIVGLTLDLRTLLYGLPNLWYNYFLFRQIEWRGDKEAIKYLGEHDPLFLELVQKLLTEQSRNLKMELYTQIAAIATEPLGGLWPVDSIAITVEISDQQKDSWQATEIENSQAFWERLLNL